MFSEEGAGVSRQEPPPNKQSSNKDYCTTISAEEKSFAYCVDEIQEILISEEWGEVKPLSERTLPSFPKGVFDLWGQAYVNAVADHTQTPLDLAAFVFLGLLSTLGAGVAKIEAGLGWYEPLNLYLASFLPSGSRKSAVFSAILEPLKKHIREVNKKRKEEAEQAGEPFVPYTPIADDATMETIPEMALANEGRLALLSPEGQLFENAATQYSNTGANIDFLLKAHAGDSYSQARRNRTFLSLDSPLLTLGLTAQPYVLEGLAKKPGFTGKGLLARLLFSQPHDNVGHREIVTSPPSEEVSETYYRAIYRLIELKPDLRNGESVPYMLRFSPEALTLFNQFRQLNERELCLDGELGDLRDWGSKLPGAIARIAGLLHLAEYGVTNLIVSLSTLKDALRIAEYLKVHALAAFGLMGADKTHEDARLTHQWIRSKRKERFTVRDLQNAKATRFPKVEDCLPALERLEEFGIIRRERKTGLQTPGRPTSPAYLVHPCLLHPENAMQNRQNSGIALRLSTIQWGKVHQATAIRQKHKHRAAPSASTGSPEKDYEATLYGTGVEFGLFYWLRGKGIDAKDWVLATERAAPKGADFSIEGIGFEVKGSPPGQIYLNLSTRQYEDPEKRFDYLLAGVYTDERTFTLLAPIPFSDIARWEVWTEGHEPCYRILREHLQPLTSIEQILCLLLKKEGKS